MENLEEIYKEYRGELIKEGDTVLDIGSSEGFFSNWAEARGAKVYAFDVRNGLAVGPFNGYCLMEGEKYGAYIIPNKGDIPMVSLDTILRIVGDVDFLKCDIEGGEYQIFNCDLSRIAFIAMEFHAWTKRGEATVEGLGLKDIPMPEGAVDKLISFLEKTHTIEIVGRKEAGGYMFATRK